MGGQSFLYFGLYSDYVGERNLVKGTIKFSFINYSNLFYCEKDENISHLTTNLFQPYYFIINQPYLKYGRVHQVLGNMLRTKNLQEYDFDDMDPWSELLGSVEIGRAHV